MGLDMFVFEGYEENQQDHREVCYWRKANAIHAWFVREVQNGVDDCGVYPVSYLKLLELQKICLEILDKVVLEDGEIHNGTSYTNGVATKIMEQGKVVKNPEICEELLPTQGGFFFGSLEYDEYYIEDLVSAVKQIAELNPEGKYSYYASW